MLLTLRPNIVFLIVLLSLIIRSSYAETEVQKFSEAVSIINLIATPERYHGKKVFINGWVDIGYENMSLCLMKEAISAKECLWVDINNPIDNSKFGSKTREDRMKELLSYQHKVIALHGYFNMENTGHFGGWSGSIERISIIYSTAPPIVNPSPDG